MPDISTASDAERTRRLQRKIKDNLSTSLHRLALSNSPTSDSSSIPATSSAISSTTASVARAGSNSPHSPMGPVQNQKANSSTTPSTAHMSATNGYPPSASRDQEAAQALASNDDSPPHSSAHLSAQQSSIPGNSFHSSSPHSPPIFVPKVEKLSYSNYTFWYMSLRLASALYRCEEHIISDPPPPADPDGKDNHRRAAAQAWLLLTQSVPEEIRHQLTIDDLSSTPHTICEKLKEVVVSRPENSRVYLMSRAQNTVLRKGDSMSEYLSAHDDIRQRMILVDHIKEDDEATTILFILCGLRQNADYADVYTSLSVKSASSSLSLGALKHDLLREEQYLKTKATQAYPSPRPNPGYAKESPSHSHAHPRSVNGQNGANATGMWCSFHESTTHDTEQCQAKARQDAMSTKWCSFHETNTHDTTECKAKARQETMGTKWCSFHESHSHNTEECEAKRRQEDYSNKWCSFHESHTHNTDECQAKARHDALYSR